LQSAAGQFRRRFRYVARAGNESLNRAITLSHIYNTRGEKLDGDE
jgi:hypothetical protein